MKRLVAFLLALVLIISIPAHAFACDESQTDTHIKEILFGHNASRLENDERVTMLLDAVYLCCEQADGRGQEKLRFLKGQGMYLLPSLSSLDIKSASLIECSHNSWTYKYQKEQEAQENRKTVLTRTVNKVFRFGRLNSWRGTDDKKCESFAALLYYFHILADYVADDPKETAGTCGNYNIPAYSGNGWVPLNGDMPRFTAEQMRFSDWSSFYWEPQYSEFDKGRPGAAFAILGKESTEFVGPYPNNLPNPEGWNQQFYPNMVPESGGALYNRSHLIAHQFFGSDRKNNLAIGTSYLNQTGMTDLEEDVREYLDNHPTNHVLYRVTPIYKGENLVPSGIQMEAYSIEDSGQGICFNRYCYNVQPGIKISYTNGASFRADVITNTSGALPFYRPNVDEKNSDLISEILKYLEIVFDDQKNDVNYNHLKSKIEIIRTEIRKSEEEIRKSEEKEKSKSSQSSQYLALKQHEYELLNVLKEYIPILLQKEDFFKSAFVLN